MVPVSDRLENEIGCCGRRQPLQRNQCRLRLGTTLRDTFYAVNNWRDTIYNGPYAIYLNLVKPETRPTTDPIDPDSYSFEMVIK